MKHLSVAVCSQLKLIRVVEIIHDILIVAVIM